MIVSHSLRGEGFDASEDGTGRGTPLVPVLAFDTTQITSAANRSNPQPGDPCHTLSKGAHAPAVAFNWQGGGTRTTLGYDPDAQITGSLGVGQTPAIAGMQVRRLTPEECEALQGFPREYTAIPHRGKPAADGPRYKALGNSWAVPCAAWIGRRIDAVAHVRSTHAAIETVAEEVAA